MSRSAPLTRAGGFTRVVVATGHLTDGPGRASPRFPEAAVPDVERRLRRVLATWGIGPGDLLLCGGARGGDLVAAGAATAAGATVWTLLAHPPEVFAASSVTGADPSWVDRYWHLLQRQPWWVLGDDGSRPAGADPYEAVNAWMLRVAALQSPAAPVRLVAVWDGDPATSGGGAAHMVALAGSAGVEVTVVAPLG